MNPNEEAAGYMLYKDGVERGPYTLADLDKLREQNAINAFDHIRQETSSTWKEAFQILQNSSPSKTIQPTPVVTTSSGNVMAGVASFFLPGLGQLAQGRIVAALGYSFFLVALWLIFFPAGFFIGLLVHIAAAHEAATYQA